MCTAVSRRPIGALEKSLAVENYEQSVQLDLQNKNGSGTLFSNFERAKS